MSTQRAKRGYQIDALLEVKNPEGQPGHAIGVVTAIMTTREGRRYELQLLNVSQTRQVSDDEVVTQYRKVSIRVAKTKAAKTAAATKANGKEHRATA